MKMRRKKVYKSGVPGVIMALGLTEDGKVGVAIKNKDDAKAFMFASDEQMDAFAQDLLGFKFEAEMGEYELTPVEKVIRSANDPEYEDEYDYD